MTESQVDRTLELQPGHVDALLGKAALLYYTAPCPYHHLTAERIG